MNRTFLPFLLALLLSSCFSYKEVVLHDVSDIDITKMDANGLALRVQAVVENPNGYRIKAMDPDVDLYLNGTFVGKALLDSTIVLDRKSTRSYSIPMHAEFKGGSLLAMLLSAALAGEMKLTAKGTVAGKAGLVRKRFPFELTEDIHLGGN